MFRFILIMLMLNYVWCASAQNVVSIKGKVFDSSGPLVNASIYISGTSYKTISDASGNYLLSNLPNQPMELVATFIGHKTTVFNILPQSIPLLKQDIYLSFNENRLPDIFISDNHLQEWILLFVKTVIGDGFWGKQCLLENKKDVHFIFNQSTSELKAVAAAPLIVHNNALGYFVYYDLKNFSYNINHKVFSYEGYPYFKEMRGNSSQKARWIKNRHTVYLLSSMKFFREIYNGNNLAVGYRIFPIVKKLDSYKEDIKWQLSRKSSYRRFDGDSLYYKDVLNRPDSFFSVLTPVLRRKDFVRADSGNIYLNIHTPFVIGIGGIKERNSNDSTYSYFFNSNKKTVSMRVLQNGTIFPREGLDIKGYWSINEKISRLLPYDYKE